MKLKNKIEDLMVALNASGYHKDVPWNGYTVYTPEYDTEIGKIIGPPWVVLEKDGVCRICIEEEAWDYDDFAYEQEEKRNNKGDA